MQRIPLGTPEADVKKYFRECGLADDSLSKWSRRYGPDIIVCVIGRDMRTLEVVRARYLLRFGLDSDGRVAWLGAEIQLQGL